MKITKSQLKQIIKEELDESYGASMNPSNWQSELTPEQEEVQELIYQLTDKIEAMGDSNPAMTDVYVNLFRALKSAGISVDRVAMLA